MKKTGSKLFFTVTFVLCIFAVTSCGFINNVIDCNTCDGTGNQVSVYGYTEFCDDCNGLGINIFDEL